RPTTAGVGPQETVRVPMRTGERCSEAWVEPDSRHTTATQRVTATPSRSPRRFFSLEVLDKGPSKGLSSHGCARRLPPTFRNLDIGVVILLEDEPLGKQRRRRLSDQLHVGVMAGVPSGKLLC